MRRPRRRKLFERPQHKPALARRGGIVFFWNVNRLKAQLRTERLSESEGFKYLLATFAFISVMSTVALVSAEPLSTAELTAAFASTAILFVGLYACYAVNGGSAGFDFVNRYLALGWVVGIRVFVVSAAVFFVIGVVVTFANPTAAESSPFWDTAGAIFTVALPSISLWRIAVHIGDLRRPL